MGLTYSSSLLQSEEVMSALRLVRGSEGELTYASSSSFAASSSYYPSECHTRPGQG